MRKILMASVLALVVLFSGYTSSSDTPQVVQDKAQPEGAAEPSCLTGKVNDPYPGSCGNYVDKNSNHICDLSE